MEKVATTVKGYIEGLYRDDGKSGNYCKGLYRGYITEKKMEATIMGYVGVHRRLYRDIGKENGDPLQINLSLTQSETCPKGPPPPDI